MNFSHELLELKEFESKAVLSLNHDSVIAATRFVCMVYHKQDLRHKMFTQNNLSGDKLPKSLGALSFQLHRVWRLDGCLELERIEDDAVPGIDSLQVQQKM